MLYIRIKDNKEKVAIDIEKEFAKIKFDNTDINNKFLKEIEKGSYKDETHFIDRFGDKLVTNFMSNGCKAAIVVAENPDKEIDITEAGINARDSIIRNIRNGHIAIIYPGSTISHYEDSSKDEIEAGLDGYKFTSLDRLNYYIKEEMGWEPDMSIPGIEKEK